MKTYIVVLLMSIFLLSSCFQKPVEENEGSDPQVSEPVFSDEVVLGIIAEQEENGSVDSEEDNASNDDIPEGVASTGDTQAESKVELDEEEKALIDENVEVLEEILSDILSE